VIAVVGVLRGKREAIAARCQGTEVVEYQATHLLRSFGDLSPHERSPRRRLAQPAPGPTSKGGPM